ncbi:MAG: proteasome accessory factor PafA2 family protein [Myxococcales bacterium]|nr:proteasome accessory factor PafA2 family protein [Myxococcales bacterium]
MLDRLAGLETEYALRFSPAEAGRRPDNDVLFGAVLDAVRQLVPALPGRGRPGRPHFFTANGGSLYYEMLPHEPAGGLLECSTPECRGPGQLLLYQQAQEALLRRALPIAEARLRTDGTPGHLGLLKNARDAEGHTYGPQENFEAEFAGGAGLLAFRVGVTLLLPPLALTALVLWALMLALLVSLAATLLVIGVLDALIGAVHRGPRRTFVSRLMDDGRRFERAVGRAEMVLEFALVFPVLGPFAALVNAFGFRRARRALSAFLVSRCVISGTGTVEPDGRFLLSEKGPGIRRVIRWSPAPAGRAIYDTGNLMKHMMGPLVLDFAAPFALFARRQRLQLGLADPNRCQAAEYLKLGATLLVLDMAEAGALDDAPRLRRPVAALHALIADPTLAAKVPVRGAAPMTALELQRWYLDRARKFLAEAPAPSLEAHEVVRLWGEALDALANEPGALLGRIDWLTKRHLLESAAATAPFAVRKKIDLRYHELGDGYLAQMEAVGLAPRLVTPTEAEAAVRVPPAESPARQRGRLIRELADRELPATVSWDSVRIGGALRGRVVRLDAWRERRREEP